MDITCRECGEAKPETEFHISKAKKNGRDLRCKPCRNAIQRAWNTANPDYPKRRREQNPAYFRAAGWRRRYGLTPERVAEMEMEQGGRCPICQRLPKRLVVDHSHVTGEVRGLLCDSCNGGLAHLEVEGWVESALRYLAKFGADAPTSSDVHVGGVA